MKSTRGGQPLYDFSTSRMAFDNDAKKILIEKFAPRISEFVAKQGTKEI